MPEIIAVRRNLTPGAVFFRQVGSRVEYSLDRVTWYHAFTLPSGGRVSQTELEYYIDKSVNEFVTDYGQQFNINITVNELNELSTSPTAPRLMKNVCAASKALAAAFVYTINEIRRAEGDAEARWQAAGTGIASAALGGFAYVGVKTAWLGPKIAGLLGAIAGLMAGTAAAIEFIAASDDTPDDYDNDDIDAIACYIYRKVTASPSPGRVALSQALYGLQFPDLPVLPQNTAQAFEELFNALPDLYTVWLASLTDQEQVSCRDCGGCYDVNLREEVTHNGLYIWNAGIRSAQRSDAYEPTNWKYLEVIHEIPDATASTQIDKVTVTWTQNGWATQSGLTWGSNWYIACQIAGPNNQSAFRSVNPPVPRYAQTTQEFDFTTDTLPFGVDKITVTMRIVYASTAQGKQSLHPLYDAILNDLKVCVRAG